MSQAAAGAAAARPWGAGLVPASTTGWCATHACFRRITEARINALLAEVGQAEPDVRRPLIEAIWQGIACQDHPGQSFVTAHSTGVDWRLVCSLNTDHQHELGRAEHKPYRTPAQWSTAPDASTLEPTPGSGPLLDYTGTRISPGCLVKHPDCGQDHPWKRDGAGLYTTVVPQVLVDAKQTGRPVTVVSGRDDVDVNGLYETRGPGMKGAILTLDDSWFPVRFTLDVLTTAATGWASAEVAPHRNPAIVDLVTAMWTRSEGSYHPTNASYEEWVDSNVRECYATH